LFININLGGWKPGKPPRLKKIKQRLFSRIEFRMISVIVPTYNYAHFLPRALHSLKKQSFRDFEVVIVDDASTDNTQQIVKKYSSLHIQYLKNEENLGVTRSVNRGLQNSKGNYLCILAADDVLPYDSLELRVSALQFSNTEYVLGGITINENKSSRYIRPVDINNKIELANFFDHHPSDLGINNATCMFKKTVLDRIGYRNELRFIGTHADYEFVLRLVSESIGTIINYPVYTYIKHVDSLSASSANFESLQMLKTIEFQFVKRTLICKQFLATGK